MAPPLVSRGFHRNVADITHSQTGDVLVIRLPGEGTGTFARQLHLAQSGDSDLDFNVGAQTNPTLYIHSVTTPITDYLRLGGHDGTTAYVDVVGGTTLAFQVAGTSEVLVTASILDLTSVNLQMQTSGVIQDNNGNQLISFPAAVSSAVNEFTVSNAATNNPPILEATGGDTNIGIELRPKGTGVGFATAPTGLAGVMFESASSVITDASNQTYTIAQMKSGLIERDPTGSARTDTLPTSALIVAGCLGAPNNTSFMFIVKNTADMAEAITIAAGTDMTLVGDMVISQNELKMFLVRLTDVSASEAVTVFGLGSVLFNT